MKLDAHVITLPVCPNARGFENRGGCIRGVTIPAGRTCRSVFVLPLVEYYSDFVLPQAEYYSDLVLPQAE